MSNSLGQLSKVISDVSVLRRMLFAVAQLPPDCPHLWEIAVQFGTGQKESKHVITPAQARVLFENLRELNSEAFADDYCLLQELCQHKFPPSSQHPLGIVLISARTECCRCHGPLSLRADRPSRITIYDDKLGTLPGTHYHKYCRTPQCRVHQYYGYHTKGAEGELYYDDDWSTLSYFVSTQKTAFSVTLLQNYDAELLIGQVSYKQRANIYNYIHGYFAAQVEVEDNTLSMESERESDTRFTIGTVAKRASLDRRRFEDAHLKFSVLQTISWYPESLQLNNTPMTSDVNIMLQRFTSTYYNQFTAKYAAHKCNTAGCHTVLVLDGNMKNHRSVCKAQDAGFVKYDGLPGAIKTGCLRTPGKKSRFCTSHQPRAVDTADSAAERVGSNTAIAHFITAKRQTRSGVHYQVVWLGKEHCRATWQPEASIPQSIIREYEHGIQLDTSVQSVTFGGQTNHTLHVCDDSGSPPKEKRQKLEEDRSPIPDIGIYHEDDATSTLSCNTEKDKQRLNERTAGILAGIWPCGTITLLTELFVAESKAQVYGAVHDFLHSNPDSTADIKFLCYDDGCHLRKYANNECRQSLSATTQRLAGMEIVIDRMHFKGHTDSWCRDTCDPSKFEELKKVDTEICEQTFSWLSRYARITKHMNQDHFMFFILYLCELHNRKLAMLK